MRMEEWVENVRWIAISLVWYIWKEGGRGGWIGILHLGLTIFKSYNVFFFFFDGNSYNVEMKGEIILCLNLNSSIKTTEDNLKK